MPQRINISEWSDDESPMNAPHFRKAASTMGWLLVFIGGLLFLIRIISLAFFPYTPCIPNNPCSDLSSASMRYVVNSFRGAGYCLVPGWLLLRLAAGLFPFSSKLSKPIKESLP